MLLLLRVFQMKSHKNSKSTKTLATPPAICMYNTQKGETAATKKPTTIPIITATKIIEMADVYNWFTLDTYKYIGAFIWYYLSNLNGTCY